ncbi:SDR family oxidoreductase [Streptomyces tendae]|uniref:SDR family oxidoreductase n=1 Tax=Streptomyces tendae TaxID=1932 RepID=UPI003807FC9F
MTALRVGVVGAGNIASIAQLPTLVQRDDVELRALVSRREDPSQLQRRWGFAHVYRRVDAMLDAEELDAVFVLTPRSEHVAAVEMALRAGVDVFCEKPLATSASDSVRLAELADEHGRILMVGLNRRFAPVYVAAREAFGAAGASFCVAQKNRAGSEYRATFENAIHMVDLLRWFCGGDVVEVTGAAAGTDPWEEDGTAALIRFSTGNTGVLVAARTAGAWGEKLDAYGQMRSAEVIAPVTDEQQTAEVVRRITAEHGRIDVLVHAAGVLGGTPDPLATMTEEFERTMRINATGTFTITREVANLMRGSGTKGTILLLSSVAAKEARIDYLPYNASKIAVLHIMWSMAKILGPDGISVNAVNPGPVNTPMWTLLADQSGSAQAARDARAAQLPMQRFAQPVEVANAIGFLTDRANRYITGVSLDVAGGAHLGMGS